MAGPYTEALISTILKITAGETVLTAEATAALEIAAGFWGRAFAAADTEPHVISPEVLSTMGRQLLKQGETIWYIDVQAGNLELLPIANYQISGGSGWQDWHYKIQLNAPSNKASAFNVHSSQVIHVRYSIDQITPWLGTSPLTHAQDTANALGNVEQRLKEEAGTVTGYALPVPQQPTNETDDQGNLLDPLASLRATLQSLQGRLVLVESMSAGWGDGRASAPNNEWSVVRIGANPPAGLLQLRMDVQDTILAACGVPPQFATSKGESAQGNREMWRDFLHGTINPVARLVRHELRRKLNSPELEISFDSLFASDLQGRARAFESMTRGGISPKDAAKLCGWPDVEIIEVQQQNPNGAGGEPM